MDREQQVIKEEIPMFDFRKNDPEFAERFEHFALEEVVNEPGQQLDPVTRHLAILALSLIHS